jgi:hypothetical protein
LTVASAAACNKYERDNRRNYLWRDVKKAHAEVRAEKEQPAPDDEQFEKAVRERVRNLEINDAAHAIVAAKRAAAGFDPPADLYFTLKDELEDHNGMVGELFDGTV